MLEIILMILKIVGIGVGAILAFALFLLLLVLFVPVRYDLSGVNKEALAAKGKVYWLFRIVSFQAIYEDDQLKMVARIFGVPVWKK